MAKIYDLKTKQRKKVGRAEFLRLLSTIERYVRHLRTIHPERQEGFAESIDILTEMRWNGMFNPKFRDTITQPLEELRDYLYTRIHAE